MSTIKTTIQFGPVKSITQEFQYGTTYGTILGDPSVRTVFGIQPGTDLRAIVDGVEVPTRNVAQDGDVIRVETVGSRKGQDNHIIYLRFGPVKEMRDEFQPGTTIGDILASTKVRTFFGIQPGTSLRAIVDGVQQDEDEQVSDGDRVTIETVGSRKGN